MRYFHQVVIDDIGQMVSGQLVGTLIEYFIVADITLYTHLTTNQVVDQNLLTSFNLETDDVLMAISNQRINLLLRKRQRVAHLLAGVTIVLEVLNLSTLLLQFLWSIESNIGLTIVEQLLNILLIDVATLTLAVGALVATIRDTLVELDAQPLETLYDILFGTRHKAGRIGILNTKHQITAMLTGEQIIIQCRTHTSDVQCPCGTGCKTHSNSSFCHANS